MEWVKEALGNIWTGIKSPFDSLYTTEEEKKQREENFKKVQDRIDTNADYMSQYGLGYNPFLSPFIKPNEKTSNPYDHKVNIPLLTDTEKKVEQGILWVVLGLIVVLIIKD